MFFGINLPVISVYRYGSLADLENNNAEITLAYLNNAQLTSIRKTLSSSASGKNTRNMKRNLQKSDQEQIKETSSVNPCFYYFYPASRVYCRSSQWESLQAESSVTDVAAVRLVLTIYEKRD